MRKPEGWTLKLEFVNFDEGYQVSATSLGANFTVLQTTLYSDRGKARLLEQSKEVEKLSLKQGAGKR